MLNNILEISSKTSKDGRVPIKIALLKIHDNPNETNANGIHWVKEYVQQNINTVKMMPICAEFASEDKDVPLGHGLTGVIVDENGISEPQFLNSDTVGVMESGSIETIKDVNGNDVEALVGQGYLFNQRYPALVKWVRENYISGRVDTSIEITGKIENNNKIIYLEETPTELLRTPVEFSFTGTAILSIPPADPSAIVLEVAQKKENIKEEQKMEFDMNEIRTAIQTTMSEICSKNDEYESKIAELNSVIADKDAIIAERDNTIVEINASIEQVKKALADLEMERESYWAERDALQKELGELKAKARLGELNSAIEKFSDEEKKYAEIEINSFNEDPMKGDIDAIVNRIYAGIGEASKKAESEKIAEINSMNNKVEIEDIFSEMAPVDEKIDEDINIF